MLQSFSFCEMALQRVRLPILHGPPCASRIPSCGVTAELSHHVDEGSGRIHVGALADPEREVRKSMYILS